ncbi:hypothetical protein KC332_g13154 [Hortaea werneckii]|uniref:WW domain-containing protein n=2 Tax=Hortaea werneckii TaxID=91943 RepID=A0A3M7J257_HORWE|nr:hypothetical protein KC358_g13098 [Hortaea werneckii]OTA38392.1 hypothetical protein BTJ68_01808 [Hortaea werneckii EXF-2000]KAI6809745.1 hypothetical protein KC350_g12794 [Hortaea werneckii]KAI6910532.1 hypothetical protein KC348_g13187 [Hortaea werneckii]KAI6926335.1 hypothetical protein KC341_g12839 [Hortaea werneckii]
MADFAPPAGPPPPKVPEGWKAVWNDQYQEWFYVNLATKQSQWEKPSEHAPPPGAPPGYDHGSSQPVGPEKGGYQDNNPYHQPYGQGAGSSAMTDDERYARQLQEQENARMGGGSSRGANDGYYSGGAPAPQYGGQPSPSPYGSGYLPPREEKRGGLLGKLSSKLGGSKSHYGGGGGGYPPPQQRYGGGGYGGGMYPQQPMYGGHPQYGGYGHPPPRRGGGGMGMGGGMALGAGAGLLGGAMIASSMDDEQDAYQEGYEDGGGGDDGGDDGGE